MFFSNPRFTILTVALCALLPALSEAKQPNIIFIFTDDHCTQALCAYDDSRMVTPRLDRIASEGCGLTDAMSRMRSADRAAL